MAVEVELEVKNVELETKLRGGVEDEIFLFQKIISIPVQYVPGKKGYVHLSRLASSG